MLSFAPQRGAKTQRKQTNVSLKTFETTSRAHETLVSAPRRGANTVFGWFCSRGRRKMRANPGLLAQRASGAHNAPTRQSLRNVQTPVSAKRTNSRSRGWRARCARHPRSAMPHTNWTAQAVPFFLSFSLRKFLDRPCIEVKGTEDHLHFFTEKTKTSPA